MPMKYDVAVRKFIVKLVTVKKQKVISLSKFSGISKNTINRWLVNGVHDRPQNRTKLTLKHIVKPFIIEMLEERCSWTHASLCLALSQKGVNCCKRSLSMILKQMNISRKRIKKKKCSKNATPEHIQG